MRDVLISEGIFDNLSVNVNAHRMIKKRGLENKIIDVTKFLPENVSMKQRLHVILHGLTSRPKCVICGNDVKFETRGRGKYSKTCCDSTCNTLQRLSSLGFEGKKKNSEKRHLKLSVAGDDGLSGYERMYQKQHDTKLAKGLVVPYDQMEAHARYRNSCNKISKQFDLTTLDNFSKRGLAGKAGAYQLDHKISITHGFLHLMPCEIIGHICNLQMLTWEDNIRKQSGCSITIDELLAQISTY